MTINEVWRTIVDFVVRILELLWFGVASLLGLPYQNNSSRLLLSKMRKSRSYEDWRTYARLLDEEEGMGDWRDAPEHSFNLTLLEERTRRLATAKKSGDLQEILKFTRMDIHRWTFGITNPMLYPYRTGTKSSITTYINLMTHVIRSIARNDQLSYDERYNALIDMKHAYGRSALLLNGSVALGAYHLGVIKGLHEAKLLPRIIFGCNTGALVAACLCCAEDITPILDGSGVNFSAFDKRGSTGSLKRKWNRLLQEGTLMDVNVLLQFARDNLGDVTFEEAFRRTGRALNINVAVYMKKEGGCVGSWLLNHLSTPNVLVYSAAVASCATALVYRETPLLAKSLSGDIVPFDPPALRFSDRVSSFHISDAVTRLREQFNVKLSIVSEVSVTRLPFLRLGHRTHPAAKVAHFFTEEIWRFLAFVSRFPVFRSRLTGSLQNMSNRITGDIVIFPASTPGDLLKLLKNPDRTLLDYCIWRGEQQLWPRVPLIKTHVAIEEALEEAIGELEREHEEVKRRRCRRLSAAGQYF